MNRMPSQGELCQCKERSLSPGMASREGCGILSSSLALLQIRLTHEGPQGSAAPLCV